MEIREIEKEVEEEIKAEDPTLSIRHKFKTLKFDPPKKKEGKKSIKKFIKDKQKASRIKDLLQRS